MVIERTSFSCSRESFTVRGFEYKCAQNNRIPVVMSHAFLSNQKIMKKYAEALAEEGYVVFTYDFCDGASLGKSGGKFSDMSIDTEKDDLKAVIAYVEKLDYVDISSLILVGASQGGFVSCLVTSEYQSRINRLILLYPALCIPDNARDGKMLMITFDPEHIRETIKSGPFKFTAKYPESALGINIYAEIEKIKAPILIIHGDEDKIVDVSYAKKAIDAAVNPVSELVVLAGAGHGFNKAQFKDAMGYILEYLKKTGA